jgi:hypothetical protein
VFLGRPLTKTTNLFLNVYRLPCFAHNVSWLRYLLAMDSIEFIRPEDGLAKGYTSDDILAMADAYTDAKG